MIDQLAFTTACTCGLGSQRSEAMVFSCDLHVLTDSGPATAPPVPGSSYKPVLTLWASPMLDPPDQVPKSLLFG